MSVHVFFNPELVDQLAACGITSRPSLVPTTQRGFVLDRGATRLSGPRRSETHVVDVRGLVTITGPRRLPTGRPAEPSPMVVATEPRTALELAEDCGRLRLANQQLTSEVSQLRAEIKRLTTEPGTRTSPETHEYDGMARRFSLLELE